MPKAKAQGPCQPLLLAALGRGPVPGELGQLDGLAELRQRELRLRVTGDQVLLPFVDAEEGVVDEASHSHRSRTSRCSLICGSSADAMRRRSRTRNRRSPNC